VHSLVVEAESQSRGIGKALLTGIDRAGVALMDGGGALLAAEVLELNPAFRFYEKQGFFPVSYVTALPTKPTYALPKGYAARRAIAGDASILAKLDRVLAERRFQQGDPRWDLPRAVDSKEIGLLAEHLARDSQSTNSREIVVEDPAGVVRASACLAVSPLEYPFRLGRRACLGRLSIEPGFPIEPFVEAVLAEGARLASLQGAERMEVTDLPSPESMLYRATLVVGARPWSRIMCRPVEPPSEASLSAR
jgi:hypothetical protein